MTSVRFQQQIALVTGAASGLGLAIATRLAGEGAHVVLLDRSLELANAAAAPLKSLGLSVSTASADISDEAQIKAALAEVGTRHGRLDIVVNSAGIAGPTAKKITEIDVEAMDAVYQVNLRGAFLVTKHALPAMVARNYGRILLVASIAGKEGNPGMTPYSSTKAGVIGLVKAVGKEFAETGITVNGLAPAVVQTPMVDGLAPEQVKYMTDKIPMKRCGTLDEVAALACFIVSTEASFTTGFTFDLSGGRATY